MHDNFDKRLFSMPYVFWVHYLCRML